MYMDKEGTTLATEIFLELKNSARRWFIAFLVMVGVEIATVAGFLWYISLPTEEYTVDQNTDAGGDNYAVGGDYSIGTAEDNIQTESDQKAQKEITE